MTARRSRSFAFSLPLVLALAACGSGDDAGDDGEVEVNCDQETRDDEFVAGMVKAGEVWSFRLVDSVPAPPDKGDNSWVVRIEDAGEVGVPELDVAIDPFMPDHSHTTPIKAVVTDEGDGEYEISPVNMWMPGLWEVTIEATNGAETDSVVFRFCVQG